MFWTIPKLATAMGVKYHTLRDWIKSGRIPGLTLTIEKNKQLHLTRDNVEAITSYIRSRKIDETALGGK